MEYFRSFIEKGQFEKRGNSLVDEFTGMAEMECAGRIIDRLIFDPVKGQLFLRGSFSPGGLGMGVEFIFHAVIPLMISCGKPLAFPLPGSRFSYARVGTGPSVGGWKVPNWRLNLRESFRAMGYRLALICP
jgi:hypothetical protein